VNENRQGGSRVLLHVRRVDQQFVDQAGEAIKGKIQRHCGVGGRSCVSAEECEISRSCQSTTFSHGRRHIGAHHAGEAG